MNFGHIPFNNLISILCKSGKNIRNLITIQNASINYEPGTKMWKEIIDFHKTYNDNYWQGIHTAYIECSNWN